MERNKIVLIDKELIIREDITLYDLRLKFDEVFYRLTETIFAINEGYIVNGVTHIIPKTLIPAYGYSKEYWTEASLEGYFTFKFIPERKYPLTNVYYRWYNIDVTREHRGSFRKLKNSDRLFLDEFPGANVGIEVCQHKTSGVEDEICNFYSIPHPSRILLIPMP